MLDDLYHNFLFIFNLAILSLHLTVGSRTFVVDVVKLDLQLNKLQITYEQVCAHIVIPAGVTLKSYEFGSCLWIHTFTAVKQVIVN